MKPRFTQMAAAWSAPGAARVEPSFAAAPRAKDDRSDATSAGTQRPYVLAVASAGGHWTQLQRLRPAFEGCQVCYVSTLAGLAETLPDEHVIVVRDASRSSKLGIVLLAFQLFRIIGRLRPSVIITTGAAPGVLSLWIGKLMGARTVWLDSIANVEKVSLSGRLARHCADLWLTQWPHLVPKYAGLTYFGAVI